MKRAVSLILISSLLSLSACADGNPMMRSDGNVSKGSIGTLLGAGGGALLGSKVGKGNGQLVGVALGALLGAGLGHSVGSSLDKADLAYAERTSQSALETAPAGKPVAWNNPDSGNSGTITPTRTYQQVDTGLYCREYNQKINVGGKTQQAYGTACRQPDGTWKVQS